MFHARTEYYAQKYKNCNCKISSWNESSNTPTFKYFYFLICKDRLGNGYDKIFPMEISKIIEP